MVSFKLDIFQFKCQVFPTSLMFGEDAITNYMYLQSFIRYWSWAEADIIEKAMERKVPLNNADFVDFLFSFDCKKVVTGANIMEIIIVLAHKELVQKPCYVANCWENILIPLKLYFPTTDMLVNHLSSLQPSTAKVCGMSNATLGNPAEPETLAHLKRWGKGVGWHFFERIPQVIYQRRYSHKCHNTSHIYLAQWRCKKAYFSHMCLCVGNTIDVQQFLWF